MKTNKEISKEIEKKITEIISQARHTPINIPYQEFLNYFAKEILALFPQFMVQKDCPGKYCKNGKIECFSDKCEQMACKHEKHCDDNTGHYRCPTCKGNKTITLPLKEGLEGTIVKK